MVENFNQIDEQIEYVNGLNNNLNSVVLDKINSSSSIEDLLELKESLYDYFSKIRVVDNEEMMKLIKENESLIHKLSNQIDKKIKSIKK